MERKMSVVNIVKPGNAEALDMVRAFVLNGGSIAVGQKRKRCPKDLQYSKGATVRGKNHAPTMNPLKHMAGKIREAA
jgi:hypothetical protein